MRMSCRSAQGLFCATGQIGPGVFAAQKRERCQNVFAVALPCPPGPASFKPGEGDATDAFGTIPSLEHRVACREVMRPLSPNSGHESKSEVLGSDPAGHDLGLLPSAPQYSLEVIF